MTDEVQCVVCGEDYPIARRRLGFETCLRCGEEAARERKHCVVPMHKSNLVVISPDERGLLKGISNKGGGSDSVSHDMDDLDKQHAALLNRAGAGYPRRIPQHELQRPSPTPSTTPKPTLQMVAQTPKVMVKVRKYDKVKLRARIAVLLASGLSDADATRQVLNEVDAGLL